MVTYKAYEGQSLKVEFDLDLQEDENIDGASVLIKYTKPDKTSGSFTGVISDPYKGLVYYDMVKAVDLIGVGRWILWPYVTFSDGREIPGDPIILDVQREGAIC